MTSILTGWLVLIGSCISAALTYKWWSQDVNNWEPWAAFWGSVVAVCVALGNLVLAYLQPGFDKQKKLRDKQEQVQEKQSEETTAKLKAVMKEVKARIDKEMVNFERMEAGFKTEKEGWRQAIEEGSFECLARDVSELEPFPVYDGIRKKILTECERNEKLPKYQKDVKKLMPAVKVLSQMADEVLAR